MGTTIKKEQGSVLIIVILFSSLLAITVLFSWNSAILQNKMAHNYTDSVLELMKAQASLDQVQQALASNSLLGVHLQFIPDNRLVTPLSGVDYYRIHSDLNLKVKLQATVAVYRDQHGIVVDVRRKTWEEMSS